MLSDSEFSHLMAKLGPFEAAPSLAIAVSGGADSLALALLAERWAQDRGGRVTALTVDHGLRPDSAAEARQVGLWLAERGIAHHILSWSGPKPATGLQAAAREARYGLLRRWCAEAGILHLLLAHHLDDQAETLLLRLGRGSGVDGLSGMALISELPELRLLRPLLTVPRARLRATLEALGQPWIEDPSNRSERFQRVRLRRVLAEEGMDAERLAATAGRLGRARQALEQATDALMVRAVTLDPAGFARLDPKLVAAAPEELSLRLLARVCRTIGGSDYPPRLERLERLAGELRAGLTGRRTFAGCVLAPGRLGVLVCRELAAVADGLAVRAGDRVLWDRRFTLWIGGRGEGRIEALGAAGWSSIKESLARTAFPAAVYRTVPALVDQHGVSAAPHLGYKRGSTADLVIDRVAFTPAHPLAGLSHCLV